jgi:ADP-L-glycero-D-manno-heptose 6-epimerase
VQKEGVIRLFKSHRKDYKDGEQKRDFLYVKDAVAMTLHLAANKKSGGLFNIGSGGARTWIALANSVFTTLEKKPRIQFIEIPETIRDKYQYFTQADISRLRAAGYKEKITSLESAVGDYVRNYLVPDRRLDPSA